MSTSSSAPHGTVIITGASSGLGLQCALEIAAAWPHDQLVLACRSPERGSRAAREVSHATGNPHVNAMELDLASLASVRAFAAELEDSSLPAPCALVCNAGVQVNEPRTTQDGFEVTFGTNHLGHFLLANLVLPHLVDGARIVFVSSDTHDPSKKTGMPAPRYTRAEWLAFPERANEDSRLSCRECYTTSKLCNLYCTYEMARRLDGHAGRGITVNAFNPCMMPGTGLARDYPPLLRWGWNKVLPLLVCLRKDWRTVEESGRALARLVTDPSLAHTTGACFDGMDRIESSPLSHDQENQAELWSVSSRLVGLAPQENPFS